MRVFVGLLLPAAHLRTLDAVLETLRRDSLARRPLEPH